MGKVITVWGSPGSGKSMFCCILAKALTRDKRKAIIINADMNVPMLPVWLPEQIMFKAITYCNPKYTASLNKVLEILEQMELAEQSEEDVAYECEEDADE